ncbi:MAG TPA: class II aldolase/adducin family protein, partial [Gaiella sp.]
MSSLAGRLSGIPAPADLWDASAATGLDGLSALVHRSNLLGADRSVANQGGGNTSAKGVVVDHAGREQRVLWVKGSGTDLATITGGGFAALLLDEVEPLRSREAMDDASMVDYLRRCALEPDQPRPSIETLLHAFVDAAHVDHTHPDAVIALTSTPNGRSLADEAFGDEAVWLDYQRPGFDMSKRIAELLDAHPSARAVLLERHGLVTWGSTSEEAYRSTIEFVTRAAEAVDRAGAGRFGLGGRTSPELGESECLALLAQTLPALRGSLLEDADGVVLEVDRSPAAVAFASSSRASEVSQVGAPCPDHLINTKHRPLAVAFDPASDGPADLAAALRRGVDEYGGWYREYYARHVDDETRQFPMDSVGPRVILIPGVGVVTSGRDAGKARTTRDLYHRAIAVEDAADALGGFRSLSEAEAFAIEYWPLERYKLAQAPPPRELSGRIAVVTGGASGIGRATARVLVSRGAHVVVAD